MRLDKTKRYIKLVHDNHWKRPIQAYSYHFINGKWMSRHFFAEWNSFDEAEKWLQKGHPQYEIYRALI